MQHQLKVGFSKKLLQGGLKIPKHLATALSGHGSSVNRDQSMTDGAILEDGTDARDPENEKESYEMHNLVGTNLGPNKIGQEMATEPKVPKESLIKSMRNG